MCSNKKRYSTYKEAELVKDRRETEALIKLYVYSCDKCGGYHLTKEKR